MTRQKDRGGESKSGGTHLYRHDITLAATLRPKATRWKHPGFQQLDLMTKRDKFSARRRE
jgi:hypothetical protein